MLQEEIACRSSVLWTQIMRATLRRDALRPAFCCNSAPTIWFSKRQNSVEASTFGSEFTAMKNAIEMIEALHYKLRMFGVPIDGPINIFCDNGAVCANTTRPKSTLTKNHHSIACHRSRETVAAGTVRVSKEHTSTNLADIFTKTVAAPKREDLLDSFTH